MLSCMMVGDSIAVGVGQARPECETVAQVGISSSRYIETLLPPGRTEVDIAVISLGVNDDASLDTIDNLRLVRARIAGRTVVWLLPGLKENVRTMIRTVAAENGDRTVDTRPQAGRDHLHPTGAGYEIIASATIGPHDSSRDTEEVASYEPRAASVDRPLRANATPAERIRRLRALRHAQLHPAHDHVPGRDHAATVHPASHTATRQAGSQPASLAGGRPSTNDRHPVLRMAARGTPHSTDRQLVTCTTAARSCLSKPHTGRI